MGGRRGGFAARWYRVAIVGALVWCLGAIVAGAGETATTLVAGPDPSLIGAPVDLIAEVEGLDGATPRGDARFLDGEMEIGRAALGRDGVGRGLVVAGGFGGCALDNGGGVRCWGDNRAGAVGDGTTTARLRPVAVTGLPRGVVGLAAGDDHVCALDGDGAVWCWGSNREGQIGDGSGLDRRVPTAVPALTSGVKALAAGGAHSCALTATGTVLCWGANRFGQIGDGGTTARPTPTPVTGLAAPVAAIGAGAGHSCAVTTAGAALCWGHNADGQLGDGGRGDRSTPGAVVNAATGVASVVGGARHSCALGTDGTVRCWGSNLGGRLGDGTTVDRPTPVAVLGLPGPADAVALAAQHGCALAGGGVWCWGANGFGTIGDGTLVDRPRATAVTGLATGLVGLGAGGYHACGLGDDGAAHCWGVNGAGELGDGGTIDRLTPSTVADLTTIVRTRARARTSALAFGTRALSAAYDGSVTHAPSRSPNVALRIEDVTTTTVTVAPDPARFGQSVVVTARVASGSGVPGGRVDLSMDGATLAADAALDAAGAVAVTVRPTTGSHQFAAAYRGDGGFRPSSASPVGLTVRPASTTTALTSAPRPSTFGQAVTLTATVASSAGSPSGRVAFHDGGVLIGEVDLAAGVARLAGVRPHGGSHRLTARYGGAADFAASISAEVVHRVDPAATTTTLTATPATIGLGGRVSLRARVAGAGGVTGGAVTFSLGGVNPPAVTVDAAGTAVAAFTATAVGTLAIAARYGGDGDHLASDATPLALVVDKGKVTIGLAVSATRARPGAAVTLTARPAAVAPAPALIAGTVRFLAGATALGTAAIEPDSTARLTTSALPFGTARVTAVFDGNDRHAAAVSPERSVEVGYKSGAETRLNIAAARDQSDPRVAATADGGAVAVWTSAAASGALVKAIVARRISPAGAPIGSEIAVAAARTGAGAPQVAGLSDGDFVVAWETSGATRRQILARRFTAGGVARGAAFAVDAAGVGDQTLPRLAALTGGGFVVAWRGGEGDGSGTTILARRFDGAGVGQGAAAVVVTTKAGDQSAPTLTALTTGGWVVGWTGPLGGGFTTFLQRFDAGGRRLGGEIRPDATIRATATAPVVERLAGGAFAVAWPEPEAAGASATDIRIRRFAASGKASGAAARVNDRIEGAQSEPALALIDGGASVVAWTTPDGDGTAVAARLFAAGGGRIATDFVVHGGGVGRRRAASLAPLGVGAGWVAVWASGGQDGSGDGVYLQRFLAP